MVGAILLYCTLDHCGDKIIVPHSASLVARSKSAVQALESSDSGVSFAEIMRNVFLQGVGPLAAVVLSWINSVVPASTTPARTSTHSEIAKLNLLTTIMTQNMQVLRTENYDLCCANLCIESMVLEAKETSSTKLPSLSSAKMLNVHEVYERGFESE